MADRFEWWLRILCLGMGWSFLALSYLLDGPRSAQIFALVLIGGYYIFTSQRHLNACRTKGIFAEGSDYEIRRDTTPDHFRTRVIVSQTFLLAVGAIMILVMGFWLAELIG